jgi:hypothetical protein
LPLILQILLTRIVSPEEERERASKVLRLNSSSNYVTSKDNNTVASTKPKPTVRVRRSDLGPSSSSSKLKAGSIILGHGTVGNQSFQEHIAKCDICRSVYEVQTLRAQKVLRLNGLV